MLENNHPVRNSRISKDKRKDYTFKFLGDEALNSLINECEKGTGFSRSNLLRSIVLSSLLEIKNKAKEKGGYDHIEIGRFKVEI